MTSGGNNPKREGVAALKKLLDAGNLRLSTGDRLTKHFNALVHVGFRTPDGKRHSTNYLVERDDERVSILLLTADTLPFCYITNKLLVAVDTRNPGQLLLHEGGNPSFAISSDHREVHSICDISYRSRAEKPNLVLDFSAILDACVGKLKAAEVDKKKNSIELETEHALVSVELPYPDDSQSFPIKAFVMSGKAKDWLAVGSIGVDSRAPANFSGVTKDVIESLGLPIRAMGVDEAGRVELIAPSGFGTTEKEKDAASRLTKLFYGKKPPGEQGFDDPEE
jgi:hypothetical protein